MCDYSGTLLILWEDLIHIKLVWMKAEPILTQMSLMGSVLALVWSALISNYKQTIIYLQLSAKWESFSHKLACFVLLYLSPLFIYLISVSFEKYGNAGRFVRHKPQDKILMGWNPSGNECCLGIKGFLHTIDGSWCDSPLQLKCLLMAALQAQEEALMKRG